MGLSREAQTAPIILCYATLCFATLHYTTLHYTTLHYTILCCIILYHTILYYTITILYYTILYYISREAQPAPVLDGRSAAAGEAAPVLQLPQEIRPAPNIQDSPKGGAVETGCSDYMMLYTTY